MTPFGRRDQFHKFLGNAVFNKQPIVLAKLISGDLTPLWISGNWEFPLDLTISNGLLVIFSYVAELIINKRVKLM